MALSQRLDTQLLELEKKAKDRQKKAALNAKKTTKRRQLAINAFKLLQESEPEVARKYLELAKENLEGLTTRD